MQHLSKYLAFTGGPHTGIAVLMVEQNADAAMQIANDVVIIDRGEVAFTGDAKQTEAQESVVRAFLGEAALVEE